VSRRRSRIDLSGLRPRWPILLLALRLSIVPAILVVRTAFVYQLAMAAPGVAAQIAPHHPRVVSGRVQAELAGGLGLVGAPTAQAARDALRRAPMMEEPLLLAGIDAMQAGDNSRAAQLLAKVLERDPRSELTRLLMLEVDLRNGDVNRAVSDMAILGRLLTNFTAIFVPELARLARDPGTVRTLAATLRSDPEMLAEVLRNLASSGADPRLVLDLAKALPPGPAGPNTAEWREPLLRALVERGQFSDARMLWAAFAAVDSRSGEYGIYDGAFRGLPGLPPFNWSLAAGEYGAAERDKAGGIQVEYYGRDPGQLAEQLLVLPPGRYRLAFRAEGDVNDVQHRLFWKVQCSGKDGALLVQIPIANLTYDGRTIAADFAVPAGCPGQWLRLVGQPTEFPKIENVTIREIRIQRHGGRA
jgi:hypothetical protein